MRTRPPWKDALACACIAIGLVACGAASAGALAPVLLVTLDTTRPDLRARLMTALSDWQRSLLPPLPAQESPEIDEATRRQLKALGYLGDAEH
jgi:hypothetical protein